MVFLPVHSVVNLRTWANIVGPVVHVVQIQVHRHVVRPLMACGAVVIVMINRPMRAAVTGPPMMEHMGVVMVKFTVSMVRKLAAKICLVMRLQNTIHKTKDVVKNKILPKYIIHPLKFVVVVPLIPVAAALRLSVQVEKFVKTITVLVNMVKITMAIAVLPMKFFVMVGAIMGYVVIMTSVLVARFAVTICAPVLEKPVGVFVSQVQAVAMEIEVAMPIVPMGNGVVITGL